ncbi:hypothetical protein COV24_00285, partial [candidate division WWE3 bacterium CG10_big_fil_rev_8_21_14_0_10_32_10]
MSLGSNIVNATCVVTDSSTYCNPPGADTCTSNYFTPTEINYFKNSTGGGLTCGGGWVSIQHTEIRCNVADPSPCNSASDRRVKVGFYVDGERVTETNWAPGQYIDNSGTYNSVENWANGTSGYGQTAIFY